MQFGRTENLPRQLLGLSERIHRLERTVTPLNVTTSIPNNSITSNKIQDETINLNDLSPALQSIIGGDPLDPDLEAIGNLTSAANKLPYFTGSGTAALADFTAFGRSLVDDADAATARATLGVGGLTESNTFTQKTYFSNSGDASLSSDGAITVGPVSGGNITIDGNEILSRNNGAADTLHIQTEGGIISMTGASSVVVPNAVAGTQALNRTTGDGRYAQLATANTFTANQTLATTGSPYWIADGPATVGVARSSGFTSRIAGVEVATLFGNKNSSEVYGTYLDVTGIFRIRDIANSTSLFTMTNTGAITLATDLAITEGGTGASTAAAARTNLDVAQKNVKGDLPSAIAYEDENNIFTAGNQRVITTTGWPGWNTEVASDTGFNENISFRARAGLTAVQTDDYLGAYAGRGHDGTAYSAQDGARVAFRAAQNYTSTAQGTYIQLQTRPNGSVAGPTTALSIMQDNRIVAAFDSIYEWASGANLGDKIRLYGNTYGIGIESSNFTQWSGSAFRWRSGGTSVSTGTERMSLASNGDLATSGSITGASGVNQTTISGTGIQTTRSGGLYVQYNQSGGNVYLQPAGTTVPRLYFGNVTNGVDVSIRRSAAATLETEGVFYGPAIDSIRGRVPTNSNFSGAGAESITHSPVSGVLWHDLLAFNRVWGTPTYQTYNGTVWSNATLNKDFFAQKENVSAEVYNGTTTTGARWTWNYPGIAYASSGANAWLVLGIAYTNPVPDKDVLVETSADGVTWTTRHTTSNNVTNAAPHWFAVTSWSGHTWLRITITGNSGILRLNSVRLLSSRWGDQGLGSEYQYPYDWDADQNIAPWGNIFIKPGKGISFATNVWQTADSDTGRLYFQNAGATYIKSPASSIILRAGGDTDKYTFSSSMATLNDQVTITESTNATAAAQNTYALQINQGTSGTAIGGDGTNSYIQSFSSKPLVLNGLGNNVHVGSTMSIGSTLSVTGAISTGNAAQTRINLGLGDLATQSSAAVNITGGYVEAQLIAEPGSVLPFGYVEDVIITETDIADDAISTPKLQANAVIAEKIAALAVEASHINAGAINASKLNVSIGSGNWLYNSGAEFVQAGVPIGFNYLGTASADATVSRFGTQSFKIVSTGGNVAVTNSGTGYKTPTRPGRIMSGSAYVLPSTTARQARITLRYRDASNNIIETRNGPTFETTLNDWTRISFTGQVTPADAVEMDIYPSFLSTVSGEVFNFDGIQLEEGDVITSYTPKAEELLPGTIKATHLDTNSVTTDSLAAGAITAKHTITGATLQTATSGKRVVVNSAGLKAYAADGTTALLNFDMSGTPTLTITGNITASAGSSGLGNISGTLPGGQVGSGVAGGNISTGTITATQLGTITGATIQTASSGGRMVISNTGIIGYASNGTTQVFNYNNAAGTLTLTGNVTVTSGSIGGTATIDATRITSGTIPSTDRIPALPTTKITSGEFDTARIPVLDGETKITPYSITTGNVFANNLFSNTLVTRVFQADSITATQIAANAITAKHTLTGPTIQTLTAADAATQGVGRTIIDDSGITLYDKLSKLSVLLPTDSSSSPYFAGKVDAKGGIDLTAGFDFVANQAIYGTNSKVRWKNNSDAEIASIVGSSTLGGKASLVGLAQTSPSYTYQITNTTNVIHYWKMDSLGSTTDQVGSVPMVAFSSNHSLSAPLIAASDASHSYKISGGINILAERNLGSAISPANASVEMWFKSSNYNTSISNRVFAMHDNSLWTSPTSFVYELNSAGKMQAQITTNVNTYTVTDPVAIGSSEIHYVATYNGSTLTLYRNGTSVVSTAASGTLISSRVFRIGGFNAQRWAGQIDEIAVYTKSLNSSEVSSNYELGSSGKATSAIVKRANIIDSDGVSDFVQLRTPTAKRLEMGTVTVNIAAGQNSNNATVNFSPPLSSTPIAVSDASSTQYNSKVTSKSANSITVVARHETNATGAASIDVDYFVYG